jgi:hypothetical protein
MRGPSVTPPRSIVLMPAYNEAARIVDTVRAARALPGVARVVVIDDGSTDETAARAKAAGATVIRQPKNGGKGAALRAGLAAHPGDPRDILLLLDADLGASAAEAAVLLAPVAADEADLAIAGFPPAGKAGFGLVKGLARAGTLLLGRVRLAAPISGQRAVRRWALEAAPIADGYGVEVAMNIAAAEAGARIVEVPTMMTHAATGRTLAGFRHRGRQFLHIAAALLAALFGNTGGKLLAWPNPGRVLAWGLVLLWVHLLYTVRIVEWLPTGLDLRRWPALAAVAGPVVAAFGAALLRARRKNFQGRCLPAVGGLTLLPLVLAFLLLNVLHFTPLLAGAQATSGWFVPALAWLFPLALLGWIGLGLVDDLYGTAERKGFRGHLRALFGGRLTTGGAKLLGGGLLALVMAAGLAAVRPGPAWLAVPLGALLIALSANALNLFDLRPGRALKAYWLVAIPLLVLMVAGLQEPLVPGQAVLRMLTHEAAFVLLATLLYAPFDFAGMMMLGDTGANPLGAFLGLCLAALLPLWGQAVAVALLIALHLYTERVSLTQLVARVPVLRWLDALGRSA